MSRVRTCGAWGLALLVSVSLVIQAPGGAAGQIASRRTASWAWGVNGPVNAVAVAGDTLVVGGSFTEAIGPHGATLPRHNLAAFSLHTGRPLAGWEANADDTVLALHATRTVLWVGGAFERIGGRARPHLARLALATGRVSRSFALDANGAVRALARQGGRLYAGGDFTYAQDQRHSHVVALDAATGAVDPRFTASAGGTVRGLAAHGRRLYVAGKFRRIDGAVRTGIGGVDTATGALSGPALRFPHVPAGTPELVTAVDVTSDGRRVVAGVGGKPSHGNKAVAWHADSGRPAWAVRFAGDGQAVRLANGTVYAGFHGGYQGDRLLRMLAINVRSGHVSTRFRPAFVGRWGVRALAVSRHGVVAGGDFTSVDQHRREDIAYFPFRERR